MCAMAGDPGRRPTSATSQSLARLCRGRLGVRRASGSFPDAPGIFPTSMGSIVSRAPPVAAISHWQALTGPFTKPSTATPGAPLPPRWDMHIYQDRACGWQGGKLRRGMSRGHGWMIYWESNPKLLHSLIRELPSRKHPGLRDGGICEHRRRSASCCPCHSHVVEDPKGRCGRGEVEEDHPSPAHRMDPGVHVNRVPRALIHIYRMPLLEFSRPVWSSSPASPPLHDCPCSRCNNCERSPHLH